MPYKLVGKSFKVWSFGKGFLYNSEETKGGRSGFLAILDYKMSQNSSKCRTKYINAQVSVLHISKVIKKV